MNIGMSPPGLDDGVQGVSSAALRMRPSPGSLEQPMQPDGQSRATERPGDPGATTPSQARRGRAVVEFRPYPTAPTRTRRSPANSGRPDTRRGNPAPTPSTIWFTPDQAPVQHETPSHASSRTSTTQDVGSALPSSAGGVPDAEPSGSAWPLPVLARAVTSFSEPGATVLLQPWTTRHTGTVPATAVAAVAELGRRPLLGDPPGSVDSTAADSTDPEGTDDRVDLLITDMPARHDAAGQTDSLARLAARALRLGGVLVVLTRCDRDGGVLVDPTGPMVTAGQNADLLYLQHIVAVHLTPADLRAHPAHRADERAPAPHRRVHSDVLVFAQPHSSGSSGEPKGLQEEPEGGVGVPEGSGAGVPGDPGAAGSGGSVSSSRAERA